MKNINRSSPDEWKKDSLNSVLFYNKWFMTSAPAAFRRERRSAELQVENALTKTDDFLDLTSEKLNDFPEIFHVLRLSTAPPLSQARVEGLAGVTRNLVANLEDGKHPKRMEEKERLLSLQKIVSLINELLDHDILPWVKEKRQPRRLERIKSKVIIGDRLCSSLADPIIRNAQEERQLRTIIETLQELGYQEVKSEQIPDIDAFPAHCYSVHYNVKVSLKGTQVVNIPIDIAIKSQYACPGELPLMIECKSAGDFTNTNKRRKEEAAKIEQLRATYGSDVRFLLYLCGYFDTGYLGYESAEGIDWIWEHKKGDLLKLEL